MDSEDKTEIFQDGFSGFPRRLPDNCVEYMLFIIDSQIEEARTLLTHLENIRKAAMQLYDRLAKGYIWQRDSFQLQVQRDQGLVYLHGTTDYGDSVEDEWLIVYLLRELTRSFPNLWIRIFDSDGEFLLVEAANVLPRWLSPEIDSSRVWIQDGKLWILPLAASSEVKRPLSLAEAVSYLKSSRNGLVHSTFVEAEAFYRLEKYPAQITDSIHHSRVTIPRKLAHILHEKPAAIAPAVEVFYLRDPVAMKPLASLSESTHFPPKDLVTISVKFTKVLFAQLRSQRFSLPPIWSVVFETAEKETSGAEEAQKRLAQLELGMKVASGFEMLATSADKKDNRLAREFAILLEDVEEDGDQMLPKDEDIEAWEDVHREDDESWLDINFEDFEDELQGKRGPRQGTRNGFGDPSTQAGLQKIVSRFEAFLNDDTAGLEGAKMDDMDEDDDSSNEDEDDSDEEDKDVSFDEEQFSRMMREMMGLPHTETTDSEHVTKSRPVNADHDEDEEIRQLATQMEAELKGHGALKLNPEPKGTKTIEAGDVTNSKGKGKDVLKVGDEDGDGNGDDESGDEEVDVDYNLAKHLLESFKSQAGMAGPAGNILGMMGMKLPRDEEEEEEEEEEEGK
ncbi:SGT1-domain-containing protein [Whalleya microplaca]|nr:SGT1-domain-containing protein [Whalleya microplaca]